MLLKHKAEECTYPYCDHTKFSNFVKTNRLTSRDIHVRLCGFQCNSDGCHYCKESYLVFTMNIGTMSYPMRVCLRYNRNTIRAQLHIDFEYTVSPFKIVKILNDLEK